MRLMAAAGAALLGLVAGAVLGYTAAFFAYLWLCPPRPARAEFEFANRFGLGGAVLGAVIGMITGAWLGWRLTRREATHDSGTERIS